MNAKLLMFILTVVSIGYPIIVYYGLQHFSASIVATTLLLLVIARLVLSPTKISPWIKTALLLVSVLLATSALLNSQYLIRFYPVVINLTLLVVFTASLLKPPSVIETLARLTDPDLPHTGVVYTEKVTKAWCCFFAVNAAVSAYTALFTSLQIWTLYNGFIAYVLTGLMFAIEWLIRQRVKARNRAENSH